MTWSQAPAPISTDYVHGLLRKAKITVCEYVIENEPKSEREAQRDELLDMLGIGRDDYSLYMGEISDIPEISDRIPPGEAALQERVRAGLKGTGVENVE